nr:glycine betaine ABC transporter substrate-binding protein [Clostridium thermarum]
MNMFGGILLDASVGAQSFFQFVSHRKGQIFTLFLEHIQLTILAVLISVLVGVPLGILITRIKRLASPVIGFANVMQAIPSLALLGFLIPALGIGSQPAIMMVFLYSLLPIVKNTFTGLANINPDMIEAAEGMGMTKGEILRKVQLPLALPVIMAGIRISSVTAVGLMTIAAFIGAGGLGYLVFSGVQTVNNNMILAGAIPACILALAMDFIAGKIENLVTPAGIKKADGSIKRKKPGRSYAKHLRAVAAVLALIITGTTAYSIIKKEETLKIGSKNFNEQLILGHMLAELIEDNTDIKVVRKLNLGGTNVAFNALKSGELDLYVEYTGTGLVNILQEPADTDPNRVYHTVKQKFHELYNLKWLQPIGFNNTYTLAVKPELVQKYNVKTFSDLAKVSQELTLASNMEFVNREDGYLGLKSTYNMNFGDVKAVDGGLRYTSLNSNEADVIDAFSTDGLLEAFNLVVLEDDKEFFSPYYAAPLVRQETLEKYPELEEVLNKLAGVIDDEAMRKLNYKVDKLNEDPEKVAENFLKEKNLIR